MVAHTHTHSFHRFCIHITDQATPATRACGSPSSAYARTPRILKTRTATVAQPTPRGAASTLAAPMCCTPLTRRREWACPLACGACEPDLCASSPCMNGGTCTQRADSATCTPSDLADRVAAVARECCDEPTEDCSAYSVQWFMLPLCLGLCGIIAHGLEQVAASRRAATAAARQCCCHTTSTAARPCRPSRGRERCDNSSPCLRLRLSLSLSLTVLCTLPLGAGGRARGGAAVRLDPSLPV